LKLNFFWEIEMLFKFALFNAFVAGAGAVAIIYLMNKKLNPLCAKHAKARQENFQSTNGD